MDIERMDFDSRRECRDKRLHVGKSEFQQALLNEWGLEGGQDFVSENSVTNNVRRAFWVRVQCIDREISQHSQPFVHRLSGRVIKG